MIHAQDAVLDQPLPPRPSVRREEAHHLRPVEEPCALCSTGGRVRDGVLREAALSRLVVSGIGGLSLGQAVGVLLPGRGGLRLRAEVVGLGITGALLAIQPEDTGLEWWLALCAMTRRRAA